MTKRDKIRKQLISCLMTFAVILASSASFAQTSDDLRSEYEEKIEVCTRIVNNCELFMEHHERIVSAQEKQIDLLQKKVKKHEQSKDSWLTLILIGVAGGLLIGK